MPMWQTGWCLRHARAIRQTRHSQSNSPSPAQWHSPPRLGKSKHSISAGTHLSLKGRWQETWRHVAHPMARWKKRHLGRHRLRYHRQLLSTPLSDVCGQRDGRGGQQKENQVRSTWPLVHLYPARFRNLRTNQQHGHQIPLRTRPLSQNHKRWPSRVIGRCLRTISDDPRESAFLLQRISVTLQRLMPSLFLILSPWPLRQSLRTNHSKRCF